MTIIRLLTIGLLLGGLSQPLFSQEDIFKAYVEDNSERRYCLYPSTLRMINIKKNEAFEELATSLEKMLIYDLDSICLLYTSPSPRDA